MLFTSYQKVYTEQVIFYESCFFTLMMIVCLLVYRLFGNTVITQGCHYMGVLTRKGKDISSCSLFVFEDNTWNLTKGLNKTTETFNLNKWFIGQGLGATDERRCCSLKNIFTTKNVSDMCFCQYSKSVESVYYDCFGWQEIWGFSLEISGVF
jgi:hypothetical protein